MYQNIYCQRNKGHATVHLWDDKYGYQKFSSKNYAYMKSPTGTYRSLYGDKLKKVSYWTGDDLKENKVFESDVPLTTKILIDKYCNSDDVSEGHRIMFIDIEVDSSEGFPDPELARSEITSIALYDSVAENYFAFVKSQTMQNYKIDNTTVEVFESEIELIQGFFQKYLEINPTIISGWNVDGFDIPYIFNRTVVVLGHEMACSLSPIGNVYYIERIKRYKVAGVSILDYLALYRNFTFKQQPSYRLDYIGEIEINTKKIEYSGSLNDLYVDDIKKFVEYNLRDVKIVVDLDKKLDFINLARGVAHLGHIPYEDVFYSSRFIEGAMLVYLRKLNVVAPNKTAYSIQGKRDKYAGAYVKEPITGKHEWVYDLDLTSMYPSIIMTLNVSPETKIGKLIGWEAEEFLKGTKKTYSLEVDGSIKERMSEIELANMLKSNKISVATNGVLYRYDKAGLIPSILEMWFDQRKEYRHLAKKYNNSGDMVKAEYFNRRQHIQKIMLNTVYGVFGLPIFRFYDTDNSEAITLTGQKLIKFSQKMVNYLYNKELNDNNDYVLYTDTDSCFVSAVPIIKNRYPKLDINNDNIMTDKVMTVVNEVQDFLNKTYDSFVLKFLNIKGDHRFNIKQEVIARRAFFVAKKRYGQWIINENGQSCDKMDIKGLDIIKSSFPPAFQKMMSEVLDDILTNVDKTTIDKKILKFKKEIKKLPVHDIATPTGVKGIEKYAKKENYGIFTELKKGAPVHVKSSVRYNDLLKHFGVVNKYEIIKSREKIKWVYLKQNIYGIDSVAFKGYDDPPQILSLIDEYIDYSKLFERGLQKKVKMFYDALNWSDPVDSQTSLERFF